MVDDRTIGDDELLFRRIADAGDENMIVIDELTGLRRASSGAFALDDDGCSIYLQSVLAAEGLGAADVARDLRKNVVLSVLAGEVRARHLGIQRDPWPPD